MKGIEMFGSRAENEVGFLRSDYQTRGEVAAPSKSCSSRLVDDIFKGKPEERDVPKSSYRVKLRHSQP